MSAYIIRRLLQSIILLIVLSFVSYSMMGLMPGDPLRAQYIAENWLLGLVRRSWGDPLT